MFDTVKEQFCNEYINVIGKLVDSEKITKLIDHHIEPDHSGCKKLLNPHPETQVIGHPMTLRLLNSLYDLRPSFRAVRDGERIGLGDVNLTFIHNPWLHWPETISTYIEEEDSLLTCDVFGGYSIPRNISDGEQSEKEQDIYVYFMKKYFSNVIGHYVSFVPKLLDKLEEKGIKPKIIAPSHGLIWRTPRGIEKTLGPYKCWARGKTVANKNRQ